MTLAVRPARSRPYFVVDVLNHLLAALVLEVDVDVRGLVPLLADEPLEEHVDPVGIDRRHAQAEADGRVGRRPAALAENLSHRANRTRSWTVRK